MFDYFARCSCFPLLPEDISKIELLEPDEPEELKRDQMLRIVNLYYDLMEIEPLELEAWIEGFWIDKDPEKAIRTHEAALSVLRQLDSKTKLTLDVQTQLFRALTLILTDHRCVDPQKDISSDLPDWQTISDLCRQARESFAILCEA